MSIDAVDRDKALLALRNLVTLTQYAAGKRALSDERINRLSVILADLQTLYRLDPTIVSLGLVAHFCATANALGVDMSGEK